MSGPGRETAPGGAAEQLVLPLAWRAARGRRDFLVSACNAEAVAALDGWRSWPGGRMALVGPARAGKSHLAAVWAAETGAGALEAAALVEAEPDALADGPVVVEDVPGLAALAEPAPAEAALFHLLNLAAARGHAVLLTGREAPAHWPLALPDLASRVSAFPVARLAPPDDAALGAVMVKLAHDRGLQLPPAVVHYLSRRIERSFAAAERAVEALDRAALSARRPVSVPLAREMLGHLGAEPEGDAT